jgi:hypothetical protein
LTHSEFNECFANSPRIMASFRQHGLSGTHQQQCVAIRQAGRRLGDRFQPREFARPLENNLACEPIPVSAQAVVASDALTMTACIEGVI